MLRCAAALTLVERQKNHSVPVTRSSEAETLNDRIVENMTVLEPNVCFHMIAVMQFGDWGVEASEAIRVTETGSELFCNMSKELHIK